MNVVIRVSKNKKHSLEQVLGAPKYFFVIKSGEQILSEHETIQDAFIKWETLKKG